jgi:cytoskeletal protein RodZ
MNSIGERLRHERLRRGFDLSQVAERTKIQLTMLEAIEADDLDRLPGNFFTRSFVRQYARLLGLDENEFDNELKRLTAPEEPPAGQPAGEESRFAPVAEPLPRPGSSHSFGSLIGFLLIVAACSVLYMVWQRTREAPRAAATPPRVSAPAAPAPVPAAAVTPAPEPAAQPPAAPAAGQPAAPDQPAAAAPAPPLRVEVKASAPSWIRATADGKPVWEGTLAADETRVFDAEKILLLRTGNAGALAVSLNGKPVDSLGPDGQIRTAEFTAEGFRILVPPPPTPEPPAVGP